MLDNSNTSVGNPSSEEFVNGFVSFLKTAVEDSVRKVLNETCVLEGLTSPYYTREEVCTLLHISKTSLWALAKTNHDLLDAVKVGHRVLYTRDSVNNMIAKQHDIEIK